MDSWLASVLTAKTKTLKVREKVEVNLLPRLAVPTMTAVRKLTKRKTQMVRRILQRLVAQTTTTDLSAYPSVTRAVPIRVRTKPSSSRRRVGQSPRGRVPKRSLVVVEVIRVNSVGTSTRSRTRSRHVTAVSSSMLLRKRRKNKMLNMIHLHDVLARLPLLLVRRVSATPCSKRSRNSKPTSAGIRRSSSRNESSTSWARISTGRTRRRTSCSDWTK